VRAARGELLVFADTHQRFEPEAIPRLVAALADRRLGAVSGRLVLASRGEGYSPVDYYWRMERWLRRNEARVHSAVGVSGSIYALRRELWTPLPAGLILDDVYVPMRAVLAGHRVGFADDARALETRTPDTSQEYRRKVRTLTGVIQLCAWLPGVLIPVRNPIWLQFVFHKLLRLLTPYLLLVIAAAAVAGAATLSRRHPAVAVLALSVAAAAALLRPRLARRLRGVVWQMGLLQAAVVAATFNGLTGRWDVWNRPR
jgi:cellulose synthase/poly-beta-1,6-N-acetylglucosamine synthase-like glycosyltransferase